MKSAAATQCRSGRLVAGHRLARAARRRAGHSFSIGKLFEPETHPVARVYFLERAQTQVGVLSLFYVGKEALPALYPAIALRLLRDALGGWFGGFERRGNVTPSATRIVLSILAPLQP